MTEANLQKRARQQSGFTLVEAIVTGIISVVLAGVILTIYRTNNAHLTRSSAHIRLKQQNEIVLQYVTQIVREAQAVITEGEKNDWIANPSEATKAFDNNFSLPQSYLYAVRQNPDFSQTIRGIGISATNFLQQYDQASNTWQPFLIGSDRVFTTAAPQEPTSHFHAMEYRRGIAMDIDLVLDLGGGIKDTLRMPFARIECQNLMFNGQIK